MARVQDLEPQNLEPIDILIVDDRADNLVALEAVLASTGYNFIKANSGEETLRYLLDHNPALILLDVQMPGLDGFETAAIIKRSERTREIPIIFLTAINKDERHMQQGYDFGAVDYIYKPFDAHILKSKVSVFVDLFRNTQRLIKAEKKLRDSERKERERKLADLELQYLKREQADQKKYRDLVDGINHGIVWSAEPNSLVFSFVSSTAERITGYTVEQWTSETDFFERHLHPEDRARVIATMRDAYSTNNDVGLEHRFITADGQTIWLHTGIRVKRKPNNASYEMRGLSIDVTRIKQAEEQMRRSKQRSDFLAEASLILSESLDYEATLSSVGRLAVSHLADWYSIETLDEKGKLKPLSTVQGKTANDALTRAVTAMNLASQTFRTGKSEIVSNDKQGISSAMTVPLTARGKTLGVMTLVAFKPEHRYDQTDLSMAEDLARRAAAAIDNALLYQQAQAAISARDEFLSIASHELRTPLTPLRIQTQSLMRTLAKSSLAEIKPERIMKMLETSERQVTRLSRLVDDLLDISRISVGRLSLHPEEFDLIELIKDVNERFGDQLTQGNGNVKVVSSPPILVTLDRFRIEQVLINLLTNATKYGEGKPISIKATLEGETVKVAVQDHGIGIAYEDQARIFERFERAVSGRHFGGLGLGLYIVGQVLAAHNGKIDVKSEPGVGSTFTVELPQRVLINADGSTGSAA